MRFVLNGAMEIGQGDNALELRCLELGRKLSATAYQVGLLRSFASGAIIEEVLGEFPFDKENSIAFLDACVEQGMLLPLDELGQATLPYTRLVSPTMFGVPNHRPAHPAAFTFLGVPYDVNTTGLPGTRFGPASIRSVAEMCRYVLDPLSLQPSGFTDMGSGREMLRGVQLADAGDIVVTPGELQDDLYDRITRAVRGLLNSGTIPVVIGGDHSISYPILRAFSVDQLHIVHFDAHTDLGELSDTGLHHGNVFSVVLDKLDNVEHLHQIGLRGVMGTDQIPKAERVDQYGMDEMRAHFDDIAGRIPTDVPCYLSIDIDVVDPAFAPATGTPVRNGMFPHELKNLVHAICSTHNVIGMDLVEVGMCQDAADGTAGVAVETILTACDGIVRSMMQSLAEEGVSE